MIALGFSAGLPYYLVFDTLSAWFRASGLFGRAGSDRVLQPGHSHLHVQVPLGAVHRSGAGARADTLAGPSPIVDAPRQFLTWRGERLAATGSLCQAAIMLGLWLVAGSDPTRSLGTVALFAFLVGFSSATQDIPILQSEQGEAGAPMGIAIDAWRIEAAEVSKQGVMAAAYSWGYRELAWRSSSPAPCLCCWPSPTGGTITVLRRDGRADGDRRRGKTSVTCCGGRR